MASCTHSLGQTERVLSHLKAKVIPNRQSLRCHKCPEGDLENLRICLFPNCKHTSCLHHYDQHYESTYHAFSLCLSPLSIYCHNCTSKIEPCHKEDVSTILRGLEKVQGAHTNNIDENIKSKYPARVNDPTREQKPVIPRNNLTELPKESLTIYSGNESVEHGTLPPIPSPVISSLPYTQNYCNKILAPVPCKSYTPKPNQVSSWVTEFDTDTSHRPVGLRNLGNTCYLNSVIQSLYSIIPLREALRSFMSFPTHSLFHCLGALFHDFKNGFCVSPDKFVNQIGNAFPDFSALQQQDSHEFLRILLDTLQEEEKERNRTISFLGNPATPVASLFCGLLSLEIMCLNCQKKFSSKETFLELSLALACVTSTSLHELLQHHFSEEYLLEENQFWCNHCKKLTNAIRTTAISRLPQVLCIHLKRFQYHESASKIKTEVSYPTNLSLSSFSTTSSPNYELISVVHHSGSIGSGHYQASTKRGKSAWYLCNDSSVTSVPEQEVQEREAYICFYQTSNLSAQL